MEEVEMVGIVLTAEQVKTAPEEVRRWIEATLRKELSLEAHHPYQRDGFRYAEDGLAICAFPEISQIFTLLRREPAACRLFLQLGADNYDRAHGVHTARPVALAALARHLGTEGPDALMPLLELINNALRQVRRDDEATLFQLEGEDRVIVHPETQWHIFQLLQLVSGAAGLSAEAPRAAVPPLTVAPPYHAAAAPPRPAPRPQAEPEQVVL
jgi:hypothetical protein